LINVGKMFIQRGQQKKVSIIVEPFFSFSIMYDFMEYCLKRFYRSSGWNEENQYSNLCSWSRALLDFHTPRGLSLVISKLPTPQFKPSYTLNALPTLNGSLGYLYTSRPLEIGTSATVDFQEMIDRFRIIVKQPTGNVKDYQGMLYFFKKLAVV
jgi:distribution and morphology protein 10